MSHRLAGVLCVVASFAVLGSCSGGGSAPTAPSTPTVSAITITSSGVSVLLGTTETFTAAVVLSNGTTQALTTGTWGSDAPSVATVNATTGLVTGVAVGEATIFVDSQGVRGSKKIMIMPIYQGVWSGTYSLTACTQSGGFAGADINLCGLYPVGTELPVAFNLTQVGATITGQTALGSVVSSQFTTVAASNGSLTFTAIFTQDTLRISQAWQLSLPVPTRLSGSVVQTWTDTSVTGNAVLSGTLLNVTKSATASDAPRSLGQLRSLGDVLRAIRGR